jgi:putative membrane protein
MKRIANLLIISLFSVFSFTSCDDDNDTNTTPNDTDRNFMTMASYSNRDEIDFAQMALTKATNDSVKYFAQQMVADHTPALAELDSIAGQFSYTLPTTIDSLHAAMKTQLMARSGLDFDSAYMNSQVMDHNNAISLFQNEVNAGNNVSIKNYANKTLPHLQMHREMAERIRARLQ